MSVEDTLQHLSSDDSLEHGMDGGSDDDLGMDTNYEYESDSSLVYNRIIMNKPSKIITIIL